MKKQIIIDEKTFTCSKKKLQKILKEKNLSLSLSEVANILSRTFGYKNEHDFQKNYLLINNNINQTNKKLDSCDNSKKSINYVDYNNMINCNSYFFNNMRKIKGKILISGSTCIGKTTLAEYLTKLVFQYKEKIQIINISKFEIENLNNFNIKIEEQSEDLFSDLVNEILNPKALNHFDTFGTTAIGKTTVLKNKKQDKTHCTKNKIVEFSKTVQIIKSSPDKLSSDLDRCIKKYGFSFIETHSMKKLISKNMLNKKDDYILKNLNDLSFYFHISKIEDKIYIYGYDLKNKISFNYVEFND